MCNDLAEAMKALDGKKKDASGQGYPVQGVRNGFPNNKRLCNRIRKRVYQVLVVRVCLVDQGLEVFQT